MWTGVMTIQCRDFAYLNKVEKFFCSPWNIVKNFSIPAFRKKQILMRWKDERTRYLFVNGRDYDFLSDEKLKEISEALEFMCRAERQVNRIINNRKIYVRLATGYTLKI